jgi:hypothetical protein
MTLSRKVEPRRTPANLFKQFNVALQALQIYAAEFEAHECNSTNAKTYATYSR